MSCGLAELTGYFMWSTLKVLKFVMLFLIEFLDSGTENSAPVLLTNMDMFISARTYERWLLFTYYSLPATKGALHSIIVRPLVYKVLSVFRWHLSSFIKRGIWQKSEAAIKVKPNHRHSQRLLLGWLTTGSWCVWDIAHNQTGELAWCHWELTWQDANVNSTNG